MTKRFNYKSSLRMVVLIVLCVVVLSFITYMYSGIKTSSMDNDLNIIHGIFDNCKCQEDPERTCPEPLVVWKNSTHYIDNNICKYITLEKHLTMIDE